MIKKIKSTAYNIVKKAYSLVLTVLEKSFGIGFAKRFDARFRFGRKLDLKNPKTLADKVSYISVFELSELAVRCTDKWEVREYIREKGLENILIPVCGNVISKVENLNFQALPQKFAIKATHGCKMNYICTDKSKLDEKALRKELGRWLKTTYGTFSVEPHYKKLLHRAYCEELIDEPGELLDYKFFCCNGTPTVLLVCAERRSGDDFDSAVKMKLYDMDWKHVDGLKTRGGHTEADHEFEKPENFDEMKEIASRLSEDFDFVRVDLYNVDGRIYFGELTFSPANGVFECYTDDFVSEMGKKLRISGKDTAVER